ncbi:MAG: sigma-70 family RNA polymerase sigma factor [Gemmataceae bacterium]
MTWDDIHAHLPRLRAADKAAWAELSELVYPLLVAVTARTVCRGWADASGSDVAQEAWMNVRAGFHTFHGAGTPADTAACLRAWVRTVAGNTAARAGRRHSGPPTASVEEGYFAPVAAGPTPSGQAAAAEWTSRLEQAIAALGPDEQLIARRTIYEGASCRQLAADLGLADHTTVGHWRRQVLAALRRALGDPP